MIRKRADDEVEKRVEDMKRSRRKIEKNAVYLVHINYTPTPCGKVKNTMVYSPTSRNKTRKSRSNKDTTSNAS